MIGNRVKVWRAADLHGAELLKGAYVRHVYPLHTHETVCLGLVTGGAIELRTPTHRGVASQGTFVLINAGEVHQGWPAVSEGWRCRTIHIRPDAIRRIAEDYRSLTATNPIVFFGPTVDDPELARNFLELHRCSEHGGSSLERQSRIVMLISCLLARHAETRLEPPTGTHEPAAVKRARAFLDENLSDKVTLDHLASVANMTPFRLLRAFRRATGLSPHAYQLQARVRTAADLLRQRASLAQTAVNVGFADQAHMTRVFKNIMGATPGQFRTAALHG